MWFRKCFKSIQNLPLRLYSKMYLLAFLTVLLCALQCRSQCAIQVRGVNATAMQTILNKHNQLRAKVANGKEGNLPQAANMLEMVWDNAVAQKAQQWADKCNFRHDKIEDRDTGRGYTGQNIAYASNQDPNPDWNGVIQRFYNEVSEFNPNTIDKYAFDYNTGHFTQIIWANSNKIGCGYVRYQQGQNYVHLYACNYLPGGNMLGSSIYQKGQPCSKCGGCGSISGLCGKRFRILHFSDK